MMVSSLRMSEEQDSARLRDTVFTSTNWFAFQEDMPVDQSPSFVSSPTQADYNQANKGANEGIHSSNSGGSSSSDDKVVVGDEELVDTASSHSSNACMLDVTHQNEISQNGIDVGPNNKESSHPVDDLSRDLGKVDVSDNLTFTQSAEKDFDLFSAKSSEWAEWGNNAGTEGTSGRNPFKGVNPFDVEFVNSIEAGHNVTSAINGPDIQMGTDVGTRKESLDDSDLSLQPKEAQESERKSLSLFKEDVEFVGVEFEGTKKAMEHALKEGIVGEAGAMKRDGGLQSEVAVKANDENGDSRFNDNNYWRGDLNPAVLQEDSL
eukprot:TRINITY_DN183_c0_g2_i2.p2 TRINITY_DN183_c0_g2~~TRINITY_DN183_c0_g2_i2.p2  ORF type:complete len:320 (+),score=92.51 TRINITY_DN183_c0_g2_i2:2169-3128(+)